MPIKFRCQHCKQFLGISRNKAGLVTDCPTCGRTIRVPNLDGAVEPLPQPALNLKDAELAEALGALAALQSSPQRPQAAAPEASGRSNNPIANSRAAPVVAEPVAQTNPVPLQSLDPAGPSIALASNADGAADSVDPLSELAGLAERAKDHQPRSIVRPKPLREGFGAGVLLLATLLSFGCGVLIGAGLLRSPAASTAPRQAQAADDGRKPPAAGPGPVGAAAKPAAAAGNMKAANVKTIVEGRITYVAPNGESRGDRGARILFVPKDRPGSAKLPEGAFLAGASEADVAVAKAALAALGGAFAEADEEGNYSVSIEEPGEYRVVLISRYQPRDKDRPLDREISEALSPLFDRPERLIGNMQYHCRWMTLKPAPEPFTSSHRFDR